MMLEFHWRVDERARSVSTLPSPLQEALSLALASETKPLVPETNGISEAAGKDEVSNYWKRWTWLIVSIAILAAMALTFSFRPLRSNCDCFWDPVLWAAAPPLLGLPTTDTFQLGLVNFNAYGTKRRFSDSS